MDPAGVFGPFDGACSYCVVNTSCDSDENSEDTAKEIDSYLDSDGALYDDHGFVIGKKSIDENNDRISESYLFEPIALSASDRRLYLKFNPAASKEFQAETDMPYYIAVLRDGELIDIFDGEYSCKVDCLAGERSFQYQIPEEYIPQSGLHTFQAMELCIILPIIWNFSDTILLRKTPKSWTTRCQRYPV